MLLQLLLDGGPGGVSDLRPDAYVELVGQLLCLLPSIYRHLIVHSIHVQSDLIKIGQSQSCCIANPNP